MQTVERIGQICQQLSSDPALGILDGRGMLLGCPILVPVVTCRAFRSTD